jgi:hypothetical protein
MGGMGNTSRFPSDIGVQMFSSGHKLILQYYASGTLWDKHAVAGHPGFYKAFNIVSKEMYYLHCHMCII